MYRTIGALTVLILLSSCGQRSAMDTYAIAYNVLYDRDTNNYEIFSMNMDGSGKTNITNYPGVEWTYTAYGERVFFISDKDTAHRNYFLYEMDARGGNVRKVYDQRLADSWMATRKRLSAIRAHKRGSIACTPSTPTDPASGN